MSGPGNKEPKSDNHKGDGSEVDSKENKNKGRLIIDATCAPADIRYPTDLSLLNEAREKLECMIDDLYEPLKGRMSKPRTYRRNARKDYLQKLKSESIGRNPYAEPLVSNFVM